MSRFFHGAAAIVVALFLGPDPALAQDVTLSASDGSFSVSGDLIAFDGEYLRIDTAFGPITLDARGLDCAGPGCPLLSEGITESVVTGAPGIAEGLLPPLLNAFATAQGLELTTTTDGPARLFDLSDPRALAPVMRLRIIPSDSDAGLGALVAGQADLALSLSPLQDEAFRSHLLGYDAFVVAVAPGSAVRRFSTDALTTLLEGGAPQPETLGMAPDDQTLIALHLPEGEEWVALAARLQAIGVTQVAGQSMAPLPLPRLDPHAVAIMLRSQAEGLDILPFSEGCRLDLMPSAFAVKSGAYPLAQSLYAVQLRQRLPLRLRQFLAFLDGPEAAEALEAAGFIPPRPRPLDADAQNTRLMSMLLQTLGPDRDTALDDMRQLAALMQTHRPLSLAFRFEPGTARLDTAAQVDAAQLARAIDAGAYSGQSLLLVGFTDIDGDYAANRRLSLSRAQSLRRALAEALPDTAPIEITAQGFGPLLPVACNDTEWGRALNRRVEVWVHRP
jgi:phosphate transport system substrate-binding protein